MSPTDRQLLFAVLALQLEFITAQQFAEICTVWATRKDRTLAELLADRGWLNKQDHSDIERLLTRKLERRGGDAAAALRDAGRDERVKESLASIDDATIHRSLMPTPPPQGIALMATRAFVPDGSDRYTLSHLHRTGGIGRVWLAHDVALRREVALKELRPDRSSNEAMWTMFLREARITGQLEHPGIVPIYEVGQRPDDKGPFYTMRFIRGQTLAEAADQYHSKLKKGEAGPLEFRKLLSAFVGVCNAVSYAHSRGVLHRDLKPQNVALGAFGEVIVLDWGLAKVVGEPEPGPPPMDLGSTDGLESTRQGHAVGTPAYMSPEQALGRLDLLRTATDVYGLGGILHHLLTNEPPFTGATSAEIQEKVVKEPVTPLHQRTPSVPPALEAVCLKALSKKPEDRYESAAAIADEVQHWLADEPVQAYPEPASVRASRWARRHRTFVTAAGVFLAVSVVALATASTLIWREQQATLKEKKEAERNLARTLGLVEDVVATADMQLGTPGADTMPARRKLIERSLEVIEEIKDDRPDDPQVSAALASMRNHLGTVLRISGKQAGAEETLRKAIAELEPTTLEHPDDDAHRTSLANLYYQLGATQKNMGRRREAAASHEKAIRLSEGPAAKGNPDAKFNLAVAWSELSIVQFGWKPMDVTERTARKSADLLRGVVENRPINESSVQRYFLSLALMRIAHCRRELGTPADGLPMLDEAKNVLDRTVMAGPRGIDAKFYLGYVFAGRGRTLAAIPERVGESLDQFTQAVATWRSIRALGGLDRYSVPIALALARRADSCRLLKRTKDAESDFAEAETTLDALPPGGRVAAEYFEARGLIAAGRMRLAKEKMDAVEASKQLEAARSAYIRMLELDPDNVMERARLEKLEADAKG